MRWRLKSPASRLFTRMFVQAQINENIKTPRHWPLWGGGGGGGGGGGDSPVTGEFPAQSASNTENVSIWWRHHGLPSLWGIICFFTVRTITVSHYNNVIMDTIVSQITSLTIAYSTVYSGADQRKHQSSASLAFVWGIHRGPVNSPHKWPVTRKMFPFDDVIMWRIALVLTFVCRYDDTYVVE